MTYKQTDRQTDVQNFLLKTPMSENDTPMCQTRKYTNTKTLIHKYSIWQSARKTQHVVYFWKEDCKNYIHICRTHKYKNTKTQIQHMTEFQKYPTCGIFLRWGLFKGIKNYIPMCQMSKCKIKCQKDPTSVGIFLKRQFFKDVFWVSHSCTRSSLTPISQFFYFSHFQHFQIFAHYWYLFECYKHWNDTITDGGVAPQCSFS